MDKFIIIDGNSLINRAFFALPPLTASDGKNYGAVYGFVNILARMITEHQPKYLCVAFDAGRHTFRNDMYAEYKGTRKGMPEQLAEQMPVLKELLKKMNIFIIEQKGIEADDIIGTLARKFDGVKNIIVTGDRDSLQLIDENTEVWLTKQGISNILQMNVRHLKEEWGLRPSQIVDLKALMGDASDNIPGVAGIGEKTAKNLLAEWDNIENLYQNIDKISGKLHEKLVAGKEMCELSYDLATIRTQCDLQVNLQDCEYTFPWNQQVYDCFVEYEFRSLLKRKDIFDSENVSGNQEIKNIKIAINELDDLISKYQNTKNFVIAYDKNEFHFCFDDKQNFVIDLFGVTIPQILMSFKSFFTDKNKTFYTFNLKELYHYLDSIDIEILSKNIDVALGVYLVNSNIRESQPKIMLDYFGLCDTAFAVGILQAWEIAEKQLEQKNITKLYYDMELPLVKVLFEMEKAGISVNADVLDELSPKYKQEMEEISQRVYKLAGEEFNINSPKQLGAILFDKLKLSDQNNKKHSTAVDVLENLKSAHPIVSEILRYRTISKLYSTYIEGIRQYIGADKKIHTVFNQTTAVTGRLSSNEPNLQNIPVSTEEGKELRKMFVASSGCKLLSADYSQIELRLLAHYSADPILCQAYIDGKDIHSTTASQIFNVPLENVTKEMRRNAKAVNFGIIYGISSFGLAHNLGISVSEAARYIERYFLTYPTIKQFLDSSVAEYKEKGFVTTLFGRIRNFENVAPGRHDSKFFERAAMNMPLQGTASDIIKLAMLNVSNELKKRKLKSKLILQIHDELILDVYENELDEVTEMVRDQMENVVKLRIPLLVEIGSGDNWYDI